MDVFFLCNKIEKKREKETREKKLNAVLFVLEKHIQTYKPPTIKYIHMQGESENLPSYQNIWPIQALYFTK